MNHADYLEVHADYAKKVKESERLEAMPETRFIRSNNPERAFWHLGVRRFSRYAKTGLIAYCSYVAWCNGRQLGGSWGYTQTDEIPEGAPKCQRCFKEDK